MREIASDFEQGLAASSVVHGVSMGIFLCSGFL